MEMRPHYEPVPVQPSLFIEGIPEDPKDLTPKNLEDLDMFLIPKMVFTKENTLSGSAYLRLFTFASSQGISDSILKEYLSRKNIVVSSNFPPEEYSPNVSIH